MSDIPSSHSPKAYSGKPLSQHEIDNLLGWNGEVPPETTAAPASDNLLTSLTKGVSYGRLPMLEVVFDRFVRVLSTSLRNFTAESIEVIFEKISSVRFGDYLNTVSLPTMVCVFRAREWDNQGVIVISSSLIYSVVDVLMGGRRRQSNTRVEGRPYTTIERRMIEYMIPLILNDLSAAFSPITNVNFDFERLETDPRFATIARNGNAILVTHLQVDMDGRGGEIQIVLPYATIEPVREMLLQHFIGEKFGKDAIWQEHLAAELWTTELLLEATFPSEKFLLGDILKWKVGQHITLSVEKNAQVDMCCGNFRLFSGKMGQKSGAIAVRIEKMFFNTPATSSACDTQSDIEDTKEEDYAA